MRPEKVECAEKSPNFGEKYRKKTTTVTVSEIEAQKRPEKPFLDQKVTKFNQFKVGEEKITNKNENKMNKNTTDSEINKKVTKNITIKKIRPKKDKKIETGDRNLVPTKSKSSFLDNWILRGQIKNFETSQSTQPNSKLEQCQSPDSH